MKDSIAIIGMACRFPGGANHPLIFWKNLLNKVDGICEVPKDRWNTRMFYHPDRKKPGKSIVKKGGFLQEDIMAFDPLFFGISPREAECLDPQQRYLLMATWEALEDAGLCIHQLPKNNMGVFIGGFCLDYQLMHLNKYNLDLSDANTAGNSSMTLLANRISHAFDFRGPSLTVDTACSSSLVATHLACQSLWRGESEIVMAGGVNIMMLPNYFITMSKSSYLSEHGHCKAFDRDASGYTRAEGVGIVVLKPYAKAKEDNDPIYALIRETGVNQDGHTAGISLPNGIAQARLMRDVYERASISTTDISYVEAHGTGTQVGDVTEISTLDEVLGEKRPADSKVIVGSTKTQIGHLEAAAGVAGLIKTALSLKYKKIIPNLHFNDPNPKINFDKTCLQVATEVKDWQAPKNKKRLAAVNSFGFGGTNAHVLLEEVSDHQNSVSSNKVYETFFLPLSARSESALRDLALKYYQFLQDETIHLADLLYSASMKRSHLSHRLAIVAENKEDLCKGLNNFYQKIPTPGVCYNQALEHTQPKIVFVYSGMGPQWQGMGQALFKSFPEFEKSLRKCDVIFKKLAGWSILNELMQKEKSRMQESAVAQPANFIIQMALTEFLMTRGIIPSAVVGHSIGEVAAAYISGALSLKDAITISYHRSRLQQTRSGQGTMLAVGLSHKNVQRFLSDYLQIDVAAINSPNAVTLAGDKDQLEQLSAKLSTDGIFNRFLQVDIAYHSQQMNVLEAELKKSLKHIRAQINTIPFYSTVEGREIHGKNLTANYWWQNVRQPVLFFNTCIDLIKAGYRHFVEIGPHPVLSNSIKECLHEMDVDGFTTPTLNRNTPEVKTFVEAIGHLYTQGCKLDWKHVVDTNARYIKLPHYQWQNQHYSRETAVSRENRLGCEGHIFFNTNLYMPHPAWQVELNDQFFPYLNDHKIQNHIVFPGASYVEAGLALHAKLFNESVYRLEDLQFHRLLTVHTDQIQLLTLEFNSKTKNYSVASGIKEDNFEWQTHATGTMVSNAVGTADVIDMEALRKECHLLVNVEDFYHKLKKHALEYGPMFQVVDKLMLGNNSLMAHLITEQKSDETIEFLYPPLLDGAFQALVMHIISQKTMTTNTYVPVAIKKINYYQNPGRECWCYAVITKHNSKVIEGDILLLDENGNILVELRGVRCQSIDTFSESVNVPNHLFYNLKWERIAPLSQEITPHSNTRCLLISTSENKGIELCEILNAKTSSYCEFLTAADYSKKELKLENIGHIIFLYSFFSEIHPELITPDILINHLNPVISLVKKINENVESRQKFVIDIITEEAQQILADDNCQNLLAASLWNLGLLFENENPNVSCRLIDIDKYTPFDSIVADLMSLPNEKYVGFRNQQRFSKKLDLDSTFNISEKPPLVELNVNQHVVELTILPTGGANNIIYSETERKAPNENEVEVRVYAAPLNFKDLLKIHHQISDNVIENTYFGDTIGMEMIGKVIRTGENVIDIKIGDTVVALAGNSFRSYAAIPSAYVTKIPHSLSVNSCSYIVYMTAYRCLIDIAVLTEGEKVLIHNATGGVGLAAIQIAKWKKAEIYATAGTEKKRNYLHSIGIKYVYDSRSLIFFDEILRDTNNYGVDVVLNAIAGDALNKSFELLAPYGRFVEIGKRDISQNNGLCMRAFNRNLLFAAVDIDRLAAERPLLTRELINHVTDCFEKNIFSPIPHAVFNASQTSEAFRFMGQNQHIGKVVITFDDNVTVCAKSIAESKELIKSQHTYLITGGTSGFGLAVAEWLVHQGATHLVLLSRRGAHSIEAQHRIAALQQKNTTVIIASIDISNSEQIKSVFKNVLSTLPPLKGIIHSAMVLDDGYLVDMTPERFIKVLQPKMAGALNLHQLTKHLSLDFFVMFSSISSLVGNPGQANYVLANGFLDAFAHYRSVQGLAATAINWGLFTDTGVAARHNSIQNVLEHSGIRGLNTEVALTLFGKVLQSQPVQVGIFDMNWQQWFEAYAFMRHSSFLSKFLNHQPFIEESQANKIIKMLALLSDLEKSQWIEQQFKNILAKIIKMDNTLIENHHTFTELGLGSLMSTELLLSVKNVFGIAISMVEFTNNNTVCHLLNLIQDKLSLESKLTEDTQSNLLIEDTLSRDKESVFADQSLNISSALSIDAVLTQEDKLTIEKNAMQLLNPSRKTRLARTILQSCILTVSKILHTIEVSGMEHLPKNGPYIICANHASYLDSLALHIATRGILTERLVGLLAEDIYNSSTFYPLINEMIPFAYTNSIYDLYKNLKYIELCKKNNRVFVLFPEGELSIDGQLKKFKTGAAWLAKQANLTIYPAYIAGTYSLMPSGSRISKPGKISVCFGKPLAFESNEIEWREEITEEAVYQQYTDLLYLRIQELKKNIELSFRSNSLN